VSLKDGIEYSVRTIPMMGDVKALIFDVFGTVVDWRTSVARMAREFAKSNSIPEADWVQFACDWRDLYQPAMEKVRSGGLPFTKLDTLHRMNLDKIAKKYGLSNLPEEALDELNLVWHRLSPWPDSVEGLTMLKSRLSSVHIQTATLRSWSIWRKTLAYLGMSF